MLDARAMRVENLSYEWDPDNPLSGTHPTVKDLLVHASP
jgi:adenylyltransferase/sulfurtransferase